MKLTKGFMWIRQGHLRLHRHSDGMGEISLLDKLLLQAQEAVIDSTWIHTKMGNKFLKNNLDNFFLT